MQRHWYRVEMTSAAENFYMWGSSSLEEAEMMRRLAVGEFVLLDDLVYFDEEGSPRSWSEGDPQCQPRVYLNHRFVVAVMPLVGDPRKMETAEGNPKVLSLPRILRED